VVTECFELRRGNIFEPKEEDAQDIAGLADSLNL
jgi:hypothetical protein